MAGLGVTTISTLEKKSSQNEAAWGYGIRYDYGSFIQRFNNEGQ
jgi:glucan phosphorylase